MDISEKHGRIRAVIRVVILLSICLFSSLFLAMADKILRVKFTFRGDSQSADYMTAVLHDDYPRKTFNVYTDPEYRFFKVWIPVWDLLIFDSDQKIKLVFSDGETLSANRFSVDFLFWNILDSTEHISPQKNDFAGETHYDVTHVCNKIMPLWLKLILCFIKPALIFLMFFFGYQLFSLFWNKRNAKIPDQAIQTDSGGLSLSDFLHRFLIKHPINICLIVLTALASYGGLILYQSWNTDWAWNQAPSATGLIGQLRLGNTLLAQLGFCERCVPMWSNLVALVLLVVASLMLSYLWELVSKGRIGDGAKLFFILFFISYPIMLEYYLYPGTMMSMAISYIAVSFVFIDLWRSGANRPVLRMLGYGFLAALAFTTYESQVFVFLMLLFLICFYFFLTEGVPAWKQIFEKIVSLVVVFFLGIIWGLLLAVSVNALWPQQWGSSGADRGIQWFSGSILETASGLLNGLYSAYFEPLFLYFFILVFLLTVLAAFFLVCFAGKSKKTSFLLQICMMGIMFGISILQGKAQQYRMCQAFPVFIGTVWMLCAAFSKHRKIQYAVLGFIVLFQTKELCVQWSYDRDISERVIQNMMVIKYDLMRMPDVKNKDFVVIADDPPPQGVNVSRVMASPLLYNTGLIKGKEVPHAYGLHRFPDLNLEAISLLLRYYTGQNFVFQKKNEIQKIRQEIQIKKIPDFPKDGYIFTLDDKIIINIGKYNLYEEYNRTSFDK